MSQSNDVNKGEYEGSGFLLTYKSKFILSGRVKKEKDRIQDPIEEVEYFGGKIEVEDNNDPYKTALAEVIEEAGGEFLRADWKDRVIILHTFQPFSKKWIWCFLLNLTTEEFLTLKKLDVKHSDWAIGTERSFAELTGRKAPVRKAIDGIAIANQDDVINYVRRFKDFHIEDCIDRMKEAKEYGKNEELLFQCERISNPESYRSYRRRLRGFNLVMFEQHLERIIFFLKYHVRDKNYDLVSRC